MNKTNFTRRDFIKTIGSGSLAALNLSACSSASRKRIAEEKSAKEPPNVILVMTDDQGYGDLSSHRNPFLQTPNLDRLRRQSTRFENFHVDPICAPTRSALMTGHYSARCNVYYTFGGRNFLHPNETTMAQIFADNGYRCGHFGKWHLGHNFPYGPHHRGFHESLMLGDAGLTATNDFWGNDRFNDTYFRNGNPERTTGYCTDVFFDEAMRFIENNKRKPFFVYLPTNAPHFPWIVSKEFADRSSGPDASARNFYGMVMKIDEAMGRLMNFLEDQGLDQNTILVFLTDNGTDNDSFLAGMRGKKGSQYEGGHRVPCFIRWPAGGIQTDYTVERLAAHIDLLPTLIDLCGLHLEQPIDFDGQSLTPLLRNREAPWPERTLFVHNQQSGVGFHKKPLHWYQTAAMTERWRLIDGNELYDMDADPGQATDVSAEHPETVNLLREQYDEWFGDVTRRADEFCPIHLGVPGHDSAWLTAADMNLAEGSNHYWSQKSANEGVVREGSWAVKVERAGTYEFELRRWPREVNRPIHAAVNAQSKVIEATEAHLQIGDYDLNRPVSPDMTAAVFCVPLKTGTTTVRAELVEDDGQSSPVYWIYVRRIGP